MDSISRFSAEASLDELAVIVRREIREAHDCWRNALRHAMAAGDALIAVQPKVAERGINWKKWLNENCSVSARTAQLYMQVARHRDHIEVELQIKGELSLRGARQLISAARDAEDDDAADDTVDDDAGDEVENSPEPPEDLIAHWRRSPGELTALFDAVYERDGITGVLGALPERVRRALQDRAEKLWARPPASKRRSGKPFRRTMNLPRSEYQSFRH